MKLKQREDCITAATQACLIKPLLHKTQLLRLGVLDTSSFHLNLLFTKSKVKLLVTPGAAQLCTLEQYIIPMNFILSFPFFLLPF